MILVDEILSAISTAMELAQKNKDKETAEKLVEIFSNVMKLKQENEELREKIKEYEKSTELQLDLEISQEGFYYRKSEIEQGKNLRYCAACYNNTGKLYPITQGTMRSDYFCTNCKMHYNGWRIPMKQGD